MNEKIVCPYCKRRLFDAEADGKAKIAIKCPKCGNIVNIEIKDQLLRTGND